MHLTHTYTCILRIIVMPHDTLKGKGLPPLSGHPPITDTLIWPEQCPLNGGTTVVRCVIRNKNIVERTLSKCLFNFFIRVANEYGIFSWIPVPSTLEVYW